MAIFSAQLYLRPVTSPDCSLGVSDHFPACLAETGLSRARRLRGQGKWIVLAGAVNVMCGVRREWKGWKYTVGIAILRYKAFSSNVDTVYIGAPLEMLSFARLGSSGVFSFLRDDMQ